MSIRQAAQLMDEVDALKARLAALTAERDATDRAWADQREKANTVIRDLNLRVAALTAALVQVKKLTHDVVARTIAELALDAAGETNGEIRPDVHPGCSPGMPPHTHGDAAREA